MTLTFKLNLYKISRLFSSNVLQMGWREIVYIIGCMVYLWHRITPVKLEFTLYSNSYFGRIQQSSPIWKQLIFENGQDLVKKVRFLFKLKLQLDSSLKITWWLAPLHWLTAVGSLGFWARPLAHCTIGAIAKDMHTIAGIKYMAMYE